LSQPAKEWADELSAFQNPDQFERDAYDRIGIVDAVQEAATRNFQWGIELADTLAQLENWETDLWQPLMKSWASQQGEKEQDKVLDRLLQSELQILHARTVAETLTTLVNKGKLSDRSGLLSKANQVAIQTWDSIEENELFVHMEDWYARAINHPAGILAGFWMHSISSWYNEEDPRPASISEEYLEFMQKILEDETTDGRLGRAAIARQSRFLTEVDQDWVIEHLVPLFDSENREDRLAVWEGFLCDGISPKVGEVVEDTFLRALSDMDELLPTESKYRELFIQHYTMFVAYFVDDPLSLWIPAFFENAGVEDRRKFAWNLTNILRHMETERQQDLWDRWLEEYWKNRLLGTPAQLDPSEASEMLYWLPTLHSLFPKGVDVAIQMSTLQLEHGSIIGHLKSAGMGERYPDATAKLLVYLADCNLSPWGWHEGKELIENLIKRDLPGCLEEKLKEILAKLGL
jgi:hypothetical protein